jgi:hypothetical protein
MSKVKVFADDFGSVVFISPNNPEYGYIRVEQDCPMFNSKGWFDFKKRCAIIPGKVQDLKRAVENKFFVANKELPGKIVVKEQLEPLMESNTDFGLKRAGTDGPVLLFEDQRIYRRTFYTENLTETDVLIQHTNIDEVKTANSNFDIMQHAQNILSKKVKNETDTNITQEVEIHASTVESKISEVVDDMEITVTADVEESTDVAFDF